MIFLGFSLGDVFDTWSGPRMSHRSGISSGAIAPTNACSPAARPCMTSCGLRANACTRWSRWTGGGARWWSVRAAPGCGEPGAPENISTPVGYHILPYFLNDWDRFKDVPLGVLAHGQVRGSGVMENGVEKPNVRVTLASKISPEDCARLSLGYLIQPRQPGRMAKSRGQKHVRGQGWRDAV